MNRQKPFMHFADNYLINPTNPLTVALIGAGGSGSHMLTALAKMNYALVRLGHPGLFVTLYDHDKVTNANQGRQLFADAEVGLYKAVALINRCNRFFGTDWKAVNLKYGLDIEDKGANILISCVDTIATRFEIAEAIQDLSYMHRYTNNQSYYWLDLGNSRFTGQAILSTVGQVKQPNSKKYLTISELPSITNEYRLNLEQQKDDNEPSCSLAEALEKQDLFINPALVDFSASILWNLIRNGMTDKRGVFVNLADCRSQPIKVA